MTKIISCPQCGKDTEYSPNNPYRPFCCERCQLIDLGDWASNKYAIPVTDSSPAETPEDTDGNNDPNDPNT